MLLLAYSAAALSKLNRGFLDPESSCAVELTLGALSPIVGEPADRSVIPAVVLAVLPVAVVGVELSIPALLLLRKTRSIGVLVAVVFHLVLSISPTAIGLAFSGLLFALLVPFLTDAQVEARPSARRQVDEIRRALATRLPKLIGDHRWWTVTAMLAAALGLMQAHGRLVPVPEPWWTAMAIVVLWMAVVLVGAVVLDRRRPSSVGLIHPPVTAHHGVLLTVALAALAAVTVVSAVAPYVGAGTTPSFTMYSNLRTEMRTSNHYVLPSFGLLGTQDEVVEVVRSSTPRIPTTAQTGLLVTEHEARRLVSDSPGSWLEVEVIGSGEPRVLLLEDMTVRDRVGFKLVRHRPFDPTGPSCRW